MLQMLVPMFGNMKKLNLFVKFVSKFIKKSIGRQKSGKKRCSIDNMIGGILYYIKSGCQWRLLPTDFGNWRSVYGWYVRINNLKIFEHVWKMMGEFAVNAGKISLKRLLFDGSLLLTTSSIELKKKNPRHKNKNCINRLIVSNGKGFPLCLLFARGTANDTNFLPPLLTQTMEEFAVSKGFFAHADKGFDSLKNRLFVSQMGGHVEIPVRNHGFTIPYPISRDSKRPAVERSFAWQNAFKQIKTISTKLLSNLYQNHFVAFSIIASRFLNFKNMKSMIRSI